MMSLPLALGNQLAMGVIQVAAQECGVDVLFMKGLVSEWHRHRWPRDSSDVDVLVRQQDFSTLIDGLAQRGWRPRPQSSGHAAFVDHSISLIHDNWPNDIDVHLYFPGFFADPEVVFDRLWSTRVEFQVAGCTVQGAGPAANLVIVALHALRSPYADASRPQLEFAKNYFSQRGPEFAEEFANLVVATGAEAALRPFLQEIGVSVPRAQGHAVQLAIWNLHAKQESRAADWGVLALLTPGLLPKLRLLKSALLPSVSDLQAERPWLSAGRTQGRLAARFSRTRTGVRAVFQAVPHLVRIAGAVAAEAQFSDRSGVPLGISHLPQPERRVPLLERSAGSGLTGQSVARSAPVPPLVSDKVDAHFVRTAQVLTVVQPGNEDVVVLDPRRGKAAQAMLLSGTASWLWGVLAEPHTIKEMQALAEEQFVGVDPESFLDHIRQWLGTVCEQGIVQVADTGTAISA